MIIRPPTSALRLRALAAATGLVLASTLLVPGAALAANGPPHPDTDTITTNEDTPASGNVLANDTNGGQGPLIVTSFTALSPAIGTLTIDADGNYVFTPAANWNGSTSTTYNVANNKHTRTGTINITVLAVNDAPVANDDTVTVDRGHGHRRHGDLLANDTDPDGDTLAVTAVDERHGRDGRPRWPASSRSPRPPTRAATATARFDYTVGDGHGGSDTAPRHGQRDLRQRRPGRDRRRRLGHRGRRRRHRRGRPRRQRHRRRGRRPHRHRRLATPPAARSAWSRAPSRSRPTPTCAATASAGFDYTVDDGNGGTDTGHVTIDLTCVNDAPVANDDTVTVDRGLDGRRRHRPRPLANDTDTEGDSLTVTSVDNATGGSVDVTAGVVTFTPDADVCGDGRGGFDYTVDDGNGGTDTGHVTVDVNCELNDAPVANDDTVSGHRGHGRRHRGRRPHRQRHRRRRRRPHRERRLRTRRAARSRHAGTVTFTPTADLCGDGAAGFDYTVVDGNGGSDTGHVTVDIDVRRRRPGRRTTTRVTVDEDSSANDVTGDAPRQRHRPRGRHPRPSAPSSNATGGTVDLTAGVVTFTPDRRRVRRRRRLASTTRSTTATAAPTTAT